MLCCMRLITFSAWGRCDATECENAHIQGLHNHDRIARKCYFGVCQDTHLVGPYSNWWHSDAPIAVIDFVLGTATTCPTRRIRIQSCPIMQYGAEGDGHEFCNHCSCFDIADNSSPLGHMIAQEGRICCYSLWSIRLSLTS